MEKPATERQRRILEVIRNFTAEHGYPPSVREIGERVGLSSSSTIHAHLKALERRGFISRDPTKPRALRSAGLPATSDALVLPVLGKVAAGVPIAAQEDVEGEFLVGTSFVPRASDAFMLRVQGDSMVDAAILDGDLIMVRPQRSAENGEIVVAMLDGEATVKRFYREAGRVRLQPENQAMAPIYASDVEIVGRVEAVVRRL
ncbi:MAG: transcriptional repressor LexA [Candidatus Eremiobacteraeota bacterium]|nr:transcriptional repressor LexA [Candidatus Eremiobacteraeota bacterium]